MSNEQREKRIRRLVSKVNKERKKQRMQIDILCNDLIAEQKNFVKKLNVISFTAYFYECIVGKTQMSDLLYAVGKLIKEQIPDTNVALFLRQKENFELNTLGGDEPITLNEDALENSFTPELVNNICQVNKVCSLDEMFALGLAGKPTWLNNISAVTIPLSYSGVCVGFILLYRASDKKITENEIRHISAVTTGISRAISSCHILSNAES
jgi:transcriptional regulator with GAF, ATPase, and Fis domain